MRRVPAPLWLGVAGFAATTVLMTIGNQRVRSGLTELVSAHSPVRKAAGR